MDESPPSELRAVVVAYAFPPVGGAGVQRVAKLVKYLPGFGVTPTVLTVQNPSVPTYDASLVRDVGSAVEILKARTLEPGYGVKQAAWSTAAGAPAGDGARSGIRRRLVAAGSSLARAMLVPDPQVLWQPDAMRVLGRRLRAGREDAVFISAPPFSQFLLAPIARLRRGTAVVLDYRDEWSTLRTTYEMAAAPAAALSAAMESALLRACHGVTTATEAFRANLLTRFPFLDPARVHAIPNGYDPDDFPAALADPPADKLVLTYAGTVFRLTSPRGLLGAIRRLHAAEPKLASRLEVRFIGRIVDTELAAFDGMEALGVRRVGYVEHDRLLGELGASHVVLCLLDDAPGAASVYPAKIFELMRLGRPVLTLAPRGALADLCTAHAVGDVLPPRDEPAIAAWLARKLREHASARLDPRSHPVGIERYDRRELAGELAAVLRQAVARARS